MQSESLFNSPSRSVIKTIKIKVTSNNNIFYSIIMTSRRETQMGDQVIFISYPLKFDLV